MTGQIAGLVLAAGASRRTGFAKALARLEGEPLVARAVRTLRVAGCQRVVVVVGGRHAEAISDVIDAHVVGNPEPDRGMLSSVQVGLKALVEADAVVVALVDHPRVRPDTVRELMETWKKEQPAVLRPRHDGSHGHPVVVSADTFPAIALADPTSKLSDVLADFAPKLDVDVDDPAVVEDFDTAEGLAAAGILPPDDAAADDDSDGASAGDESADAAADDEG